MMNEQPRTWAESLLVAYVDGQLDAAQMQAVETALRSDAEARAIVSVLRASGAAVKQAYDEALERPLPAGLRSLFADVPATAAESMAPTAANVVAFRRRAGMQRLLPMAASIAALLIGFGAGYATFGDRAAFTPAGEDARGELYLAALQRALDIPAAGTSQDYADPAAGIGGRVTVIGPVVTANLGKCREFRHDASENGATVTSFGVACPGAGGSWLIEVNGPGGE
jgi:DNA-binding FrmR family transcriptional regulator